ncbi:type 1 glutamine amidotransferase domain-containing protein [Salipiger sp. 1_MG-2023]|uniref:type 1 glutamine amidotransferase domain-containing protein n=1 Tax=Salipiger sp. 1_MG-2023 TaxID=3062665 RepID=UPI0026E3C249|nr:type 1 glutamine amidotransferase domain-containing protein [Salipiger sp. 1_MG-2023]MDO6586333.1 type 1 glutamine amidotransferase domain-containing protein [Salipiger sp. 1_MG-2023]
MAKITEAKILIISTNGFEQSELEFPRDQLRAKGAEVHVATLDGKAITGWEGTDWGREAEADLAVEDADATKYDALVIPGGQINPDILRTKPEVIALVRAFAHQGKAIAAVCHGPWVLIEAEIVAGREMTGYPSIRTDLKNAGARVVDVPVACDSAIITSRTPDDLEAFVAKIVEEVEEGRHNQKAA